MRSQYTPAQLEFLRREYKHLRLAELTRAFNKRFKVKKTPVAIHATLTRFGIRCGKIDGKKRGTKPGCRIFNEKQLEFIRQNYKKLNRTQLADAFNKRFRKTVTPKQLSSFVSRYKILSGRTGQFQKGRKPWNTGTKGAVKPNSGNFKKGQKSLNEKPIGHERLCAKDGYILIKVKERNPYTGAATRYKAKHVVIWEKKHGKIPAGLTLLFKDGNRKNCKLSNLTTITRAERLYLNRNGYNDLPAKLKPSMLALARLETKRFAMEKKK